MYIKYLFSLIFVTLMYLSAQLFGNNEIIFPEILAVLLGAWCLPKMPWKIDGIRMFLLMTAAAFFGVILVRYFHVPFTAKIIIGLVFTGILLFITNATMMPMISACILPVYLGTDSFVYPISVGIMVGIIIIIQNIMMKFNMHQETKKFEYKLDFKSHLKFWFVVISVTIIVGLAPWLKGDILYIVPPLIVMFAECCYKNLNGKYKQIWIDIFVAAIIGWFCRSILVDYLNIPLIVCGILATVLTFCLFEITKMYFPPACAIALLPSILPTVALYPIKVGIGAAILCIIAKLLRKYIIIDEKSVKN